MQKSQVILNQIPIRLLRANAIILTNGLIRISSTIHFLVRQKWSQILISLLRAIRISPDKWLIRIFNSTIHFLLRQKWSLTNCIG